MISNLRFLDIKEVLYFHSQEIKRSGGNSRLRDINSLKAAIEAPKATFDGEFLMDIFEMAATYVESICFNHPFIDGNKRTAALSAVAFLYFNGVNYEEEYEEELADKVLELVTRKIKKNDLAVYFQRNSKEIL